MSPYCPPNGLERSIIKGFMYPPAVHLNRMKPLIAQAIKGFLFAKVTDEYHKD